MDEDEDEEKKIGPHPDVSTTLIFTSHQNNGIYSAFEFSMKIPISCAGFASMKHNFIDLYRYMKYKNQFLEKLTCLNLLLVNAQLSAYEFSVLYYPFVFIQFHRVFCWGSCSYTNWIH